MFMNKQLVATLLCFDELEDAYNSNMFLSSQFNLLFNIGSFRLEPEHYK